MSRHRPFIQACAVLFGGAALFVAAQTPAPPVPALTQEQREAAAAIEVPKPFTPPPLPGQLQNNGLAKPAAPAKAAVPPPAPAPANSASKLKALEAATQTPTTTEAPRVAAPSDKIPVTSSTSTSRQFIVHGKVFQTRSAMSTRCDEIAAELRKVLNDKEPWVLPIVVLLITGDEAAQSKGLPISTAITEITHGGFHLQVTINDRPGLNAAELRKEVVRALLAERILRNHPALTKPAGRLLLPDWVMTGVLNAMDYRASARPSALFATIFRSGKIYGIEEIIETSPVEMDGLSRTIYETSCSALVLALADQPGGPQHFNQFLNALASDPRSERELLSAAFPNFAASAPSLNKWWSLQLAALSKPGIAEPLTAAESLKAIEDAITIRYEAPPAEVPKNVKLHPFVLPPSLVVASSEPNSPPPATADDSPKPKSKATAATSDDAPPAAEKPKRSLLRRLLFLGPADEDEPKTADKSKAKDKPAETTAADRPPATDKTAKHGVLDRFFGGDSSSENEQPAAKADKSKAAEIEKPKTGDKKKAADDKEAKPSLLNPLNWFRSDKKPAAEKNTGKPAKDEQTSLTPPAAFDVARLLSPALADAWEWLAPAAPHLTGTLNRPDAAPLLDFRKRNEAEGKTSEPKKAAAPKKSSSKPAVASKTDAKKVTQPRTSNPNSTPAARPAATPSGTPRTTNPNAKPVPPGLIKPGTTVGTGAAAATKSGLVPVVLPLEEYQHIFKHPDRAHILRRNAAALIALQTRVSVLFRPVVDGYLAVVRDLLEGKDKDIDQRLAVLHEFTLVAYQKSVAVRDYLDWFEASETSRLSGKFDDYLNLPATIQKELPPRTDPVSKYLDAIDKEFSK